MAASTRASAVEDDIPKEYRIRAEIASLLEATRLALHDATQVSISLINHGSDETIAARLVGESLRCDAIPV